MKAKNLVILLLIFIVIALGIYFIFFNKNNQTDSNSSVSNYSANRTSYDYGNNNTNTNTASPENKNTSETQATNEAKKNEENKEPVPPIETEISSFTTQIINKDKARQNNIAITCNSLNDKLVENGQTFSFCGTVGQASTAKGYQKAEIFDNKRWKENGIRWRQLSNKYNSL